MMQKEIIAKCNHLGKPVITATQMLDSMIRNPRPTRAEVSDVANAILDGTDALMLSGETAVGSYPIASVQTMMRTAAQVERAGRIHSLPPSAVMLGAHIGGPRSSHTIADAVSHAACQTAHELNAVAIVTPTVSGYTARMVAKYRPAMPIVATTHNPRVQRQLMLQWGVHPLLSSRADDTDQTITEAIRTAQRSGVVKTGDILVLTAGSAGSGPGTTNLLEVQVVGPS